MKRTVISALLLIPALFAAYVWYYDYYFISGQMPGGWWAALGLGED